LYEGLLYALSLLPMPCLVIEAAARRAPSSLAPAAAGRRAAALAYYESIFYVNFVLGRTSRLDGIFNLGHG
jgi:hypothetical protein